MSATPGPWEVTEIAKGQAFAVRRERITKSGIRTKDVICFVSDMPTPEARANATLIAKAPEMFQIIEKLLTARQRKLAVGKDLIYTAMQAVAWEEAAAIIEAIRGQI